MGTVKLRTLQLGIREIGGERRMVFEQLDGSVILGSECLCHVSPFLCPIDKHAIECRQAELREGAD